MAVVNILHTRWQERRKRKDERDALLALLYAEIHLNDIVLKEFIDDERELKVLTDGAYPRIETWNNCSVKLAQLIKADDIIGFIGYYYFASSVLGTLNDTINYSENTKLQNVRTSVRLMLHHSPAARQVAKKYLNLKDLPAFSDSDLACVLTMGVANECAKWPTGA